jgi:hypothetical protein
MLVQVDLDPGWGATLATRIDSAIEGLAADRDVISVAVTPSLARHSSEGGEMHGMPVFLTASASTSFVVTVIWREDDPHG